MADNKFSGKYSEGTFKGGEGPVLGQSIVNESERKGLLNPDTDGRNIKTVGGKSTDNIGGKGSDGLFDIYGAGYKGPQNMKPKDEGESNNFDIKGK
jgi:hypothetical protein